MHSRPLLWLMLFALVVRGGVLLVRSAGLERDPDAYRDVAEGLGQHWVFGIAVDSDTPAVPTANRAPLYPVLLAVLGVTREQGAIAIGLAHLVLGVSTVGMVWLLAERMGLKRGAMVAAGLVAVDPILLNQSTEVMTETLATFLVTSLLLVLSLRQMSWHTALAAGMLAGLAALCRPTFLPFAMLIPFAWLWHLRGSGRVMKVLSAYVIGSVVVLAPWAIRNQQVFGRPIVTTTHGGYTLLLGNNPAFYEFLRTESWSSAWFPVGYEVWAPKRDEAYEDYPDYTSFYATPRLINVPEQALAEDERNYQLAFHNMAEDPGGAAQACLYRVTSLWGLVPKKRTTDESTLRTAVRWRIGAFYFVMFALAIRGVWAIRQQLFAMQWLPGLLLVAVVTGIHLFYWTDMRMRAPLVPVIALWAAAGWGHWRDRRKAARSETPSDADALQESNLA